MSTEPSAAVARVIVTVRGFRVILSSDLARVYGVEPRALNQAVKRNAERFPPDFAFRLSKDDMTAIRRSRSQSVTLKEGSPRQVRTARLHGARHTHGGDRAQ